MTFVINVLMLSLLLLLDLDGAPATAIWPPWFWGVFFVLLFALLLLLLFCVRGAGWSDDGQMQPPERYANTIQYT